MVITDCHYLLVITNLASEDELSYFGKFKGKYAYLGWPKEQQCRQQHQQHRSVRSLPLVVLNLPQVEDSSLVFTRVASRKLKVTVPTFEGFKDNLPVKLSMKTGG